MILPLYIETSRLSLAKVSLTVLDLNTLQQAAKAGSRQAEKVLFEVLSERFQVLAYQKVWNREDAREVAQEALAVVVQSLPTLDIHTSFAAWAQRVLENRLLAYIKVKQSRQKRDGGTVDPAQEPPAGPEDSALKRRLLSCLEEVARRNRRYARILNLHYQGFDTAEICRRLEVTENNCYVLLTRSRSLLRDCLDKKGHVT